MNVCDDLEQLSRTAAVRFVSLFEEAIARHGRFDVALSGGSTPKRMYELLALPEYSLPVDWTQVHLFWSDERYVPPTDPQSNEHMARAALISQIPIPEGNVHGMYVEGGVESAAHRYQNLLREQLGLESALDLTMLGLGPDGHTASLFPGEPAVHETERIVVAGLGHAGVSERITMTPPMLNRSRFIMFLVSGADKAAPLCRVLAGPEDWDGTPAQAIARHAPNVEWFVDRAACPS
ncbi:MAG: 6-phosphogluconolactonase [Fimbriimonas sp.]|nr:6-phosphogluconolactonase [Fimbriimonas sp.]